MTTENDQVLVQKFGNVAETDEFKSECQKLMNQFSLDAEELFYKWESYAMNTENDVKPTCDELVKLQKHIMDDLEKENQRSAKKPRLSMPTSSSRKLHSGNSSPESFLDSMLSTPASRKRRPLQNGSGGSNLQTPSRLKHDITSDIGGDMQSPVQKMVIQPQSPSRETPYKSRKDAGKITETLNEHVIEPTTRQHVPENNTVFQLNVDLKKYSFRTMRMKLSEVAEYFDDKVESLVDMLVKSSQYGLTEENIGNPANMSQSEVVAVGRIVADSVDKLNAGSLLFETCRRIGAGMQVRLDVSELESYSFFPGQVMAIRGKNMDGKVFTVLEVLDSFPMITAATSKSDLEAIASRQTEPTSIVTAAGPFTTSDNLYYEPLDDLITHINMTHPDVAILTGPFVDITHPSIQEGDYDIPDENTDKPLDNGTLDDFFRAVVTPKLNSIDSNTTVILIPSVKDATSAHAAFPQQQLDRKQLKLSKNIKCLSNPATFSINEVVFSVNSMDAIKDLAATMTQHNPKHRGLFGAINHILSSKSMYPVSPPPQKHNNEGLEISGGSIDTPFKGLAEFTHAMPDVLITPSLLKPLAEVAQNVVVVNPGLLAKKTGGGTFASFTIKPPGRELLDNGNDPVSHELWSRARVDITKL